MDLALKHLGTHKRGSYLFHVNMCYRFQGTKTVRVLYDNKLYCYDNFAKGRAVTKASEWRKFIKQAFIDSSPNVGQYKITGRFPFYEIESA